MEKYLFLADGEGAVAVIILLIIIVPITWWWEYFEKPRRKNEEFRDTHKVCPFCRKVIHRDASICAYCRSNV